MSSNKAYFQNAFLYFQSSNFNYLKIDQFLLNNFIVLLFSVMELGGCRGELEQDQKNNNEQKMSHCPVPGDTDHLPEVPAPASKHVAVITTQFLQCVLGPTWMSETSVVGK